MALKQLLVAGLLFMQTVLCAGQVTPISLADLIAMSDVVAAGVVIRIEDTGQKDADFGSEMMRAIVRIEKIAKIPKAGRKAMELRIVYTPALSESPTLEIGKKYIFLLAQEKDNYSPLFGSRGVIEVVNGKVFTGPPAPEWEDYVSFLERITSHKSSQTP